MYYVISREGVMVGVTKENAYIFNLPNISIHEFDEDIPDLNTSVWDSETETLVTQGGMVTKLTFLNRLTVTERLAIRASTDPVVNDIIKLLEVADFVDTTDNSTIQGVQYLAMVGLITSERISEVLA